MRKGACAGNGGIAVTATCEQCGRQFERSTDESHKKLCKACWCAERGNGARDQEAQILHDQETRVHANLG